MGPRNHSKKLYKHYQAAFEGNVEASWLALGLINVIVLGLTLLFQSRKDVI